MAEMVTLNVNGRPRNGAGPEGKSLLFALREDLGLLGTHYGCGEGQCGACTVLVDGKPMRSCLLNVDRVKGRQVTSVEGLASEGKLHPLQQAFLEEDALQCGYCTSGMLMSGAALLARYAAPTRTQIVRAMEGNICRCGTYTRIIAAVQRAATITQEQNRG
ncbi:MAG TPA: (2Fe-2S)-binding protein [Candidatus Handelsmanbacteria bacterium]|nr:(2Fe-2S)-binding protein [Candidatus Handelsmanbacteria bacterium]